MADNFAVILELNEHADAKQYTVAAGTSISKGDLLRISGDNTVSASTANSEVYGGVAAADKDGTDSSTKLGVHVPGALNKFDMTCGGAGVTRGSLVSLSGANLIKDATEAEVITGDVIGRVEETGDAAEVVAVLS
ncbi:hypothetical protein LCGC14_3155930 [marine sediment metagenome]|uniref:Uncharacterized protein n=1 Tax=marine sediment metagenome TaxID=412755 RepID=A0A0F8VSU1_9ZZZZ